MPGNLVGKTLSHYRILEQLGAGGMGIVYKAQDTTLGRNVAIKLLPASASDDRDAIERFRREARTASALNHPNICTIYGFAEYEGQFLLSMELLDGDPLDKKIDGKPLEMRLLLNVATQIADALEAAHSGGVLHRDIKPANIYITRRSQVKVLDFGLAKLAHGRQDLRVTQQFSSITGTTVGTVSYMSPEQARGEELDARTDLFSFGVVLYEMATGRQSFHGATTAVIFDGILNRQPAPPSSVNAAIPPQLEHIILKALEKDRALRYQTAADMRADLERLKRDSATLLPAGSQSQSLSPESTTPSTPGATVVPTPRPAEPPTGSQLSPLRRLSPSAIAALVIGGIAFLFLIGMLVSTVFRLQSGRSETTTQGAPTPASPQQSASTPSTIPAEAPPPSPPATPDPAKPNAAAKADPKVAIPGTAGTTPASTTPPAPPARGAATTDAEAAERLDVAQAKIAANLMEPALNDLRQLINDYPRTPAAAEATFLSASLLEKLGRMDDAMAAHVEFSRRYATDRRVPDSKLRLADLLLKSRRPDREAAARTVYAEVATQFPRTPQALSALQAKIRLETERRNLREVDPMLGVAMPAMVLSMRMLTQQFPDNPASMVALNRLVELYEDANQYAFAAQALSDLATRFPDGAPDAWYRLGELYERRLKDPARAREAYERVPSSSPRYRDAQRKLKR